MMPVREDWTFYWPCRKTCTPQKMMHDTLCRTESKFSMSWRWGNIEPGLDIEVSWVVAGGTSKKNNMSSLAQVSFHLSPSYLLSSGMILLSLSWNSMERIRFLSSMKVGNLQSLVADLKICPANCYFTLTLQISGNNVKLLWFVVSYSQIHQTSQDMLCPISTSQLRSEEQVLFNSAQLIL